MRQDCGWIDEALRGSFLPKTEVVKRDGGHLLIAHESIPVEADHVTVCDGRYVVIPNPSAKEEA